MSSGDKAADDAATEDADKSPAKSKAKVKSKAKSTGQLRSADEASNAKAVDLKPVGNPDLFLPLYETVSECVRAMQVPGGCLVLVSSHHGEALAFVPGATIQDDINGGRKLAYS